MSVVLTRSRALNALRAYVSYALSRFGSVRFAHKPLFVSVEPAAVCQLRCPACPVGLRNNEKPIANSQKLMSCEVWERVLREVSSYAHTIQFYFQGEPLLNKDLPRMIREAHDAGLYTIVSTNAQAMTQDMAQALEQTIAEQQSDVISQDTVRIFNSHLQLTDLRGRATIAVGVKADGQMALKGQCSAATIISLSDKRASGMLWMMTMMWLLFCYYRHRQLHEKLPVAVAEMPNTYGGLAFCASVGMCVVSSGETLRLTPMQQQLMEMFFNAPSHRLTKQEICDALWPKKPDASDTLYTLIRRLRPILEQNTSLVIESDRRKTYELRVRSNS